MSEVATDAELLALRERVRLLEGVLRSLIIWAGDEGIRAVEPWTRAIWLLGRDGGWPQIRVETGVMPPDVAEFRDASGRVLARIVNIGSDSPPQPPPPDPAKQK